MLGPDSFRVSAGGHGSASFLAGGGEMGALMRRHDWAASALGPPEDWPQSLKTAIRIMLTSRQPIWVGWGRELTFFYNDAYRAIVGGKHPWALGRPTSAVWREIWVEIGPMLATAMGGVEGTYVEEQLLVMERNGYPEETYYTFSYSPIPDDDGSAGGIICANADDTKRVIGERQLALLRDLSAAMAGTRSWTELFERAAGALASNAHDLPFAMIYMTAGGRILSLMAAAGIEADHAQAPETVDTDAPSEWPFAEVLDTQEVRIVPVAAGRRLPTGAWHESPSQVALLPIPATGETGRAGVLVVGLNPFRLLDANYRDFLRLVAGQVAAAVGNAEAFENERLRAESLAEIDRAKTAFFSNVSHEFRTPLTLMLGPLEESLAEAARLPAGHRAQLEVVHRNGMRLLKLVNSLLDFSRIEAGRMRASFEPTDIAAFTTELAANFRSATEKAGLMLDIECAPLTDPVYVDREMWEKIVLNLLSNAFKFTFLGGIKVSVSQSGRTVRMGVQDTGTGIPAAELPRLFERFHRVEGARGRSFEGSGIGLALVKELVDAHGGTIDVQSVEDCGTTFTIALPLGHAHLPADQVHGAKAAGASAVKAQAYVEEVLRWLPNEAHTADATQTLPANVDSESLQHGHQGRSSILVVDDNADMREYISRLLGVRHWCEAVEDGEQALAAARRDRPDLILTDVMMPRMNGFELIRAIRADAGLLDLPIIVLSARAGEESSVEGLGAGADDYLAKPFSARELNARVDGALAMAKVRRDMGDALREKAQSLELSNRALRESEERQTRLNQSLEGIVAERTAALEAANEGLRTEAAEREKIEGVLRQSQKMDAVGKLTGGVAHDFNNLLQVIGGNLQLLTNDVAGNARGEQRLRNALAGVLRGSKLAAQLLAFGRRQPLAPKVVNLGRFVQGLDDLLRRALGDGVEIETVIAGGLWNTLVDPSQVENALLNLGINARDAMRAHGKLTIEAGNALLDDDYALRNAEVVPGQYVMLAVTDTGCGMTPQVIEHVFEPFFTTKPEGQGTGLGLSMVYGFVKQSDGHIKIYSEPGQGTTIRLYLPRAHGAEDVVAEADAGQVVGGTETVLVVEDDDEVRATVVELLADLGYRVLKAREAQSALAIIESGTAIDLLFTDVVMPGPLRSPDLARQARVRLPEVAVLFTSGYTDSAIVHGGRLDQGIELLSKPYTREALARKIRHVLRNQRQRNTGAEPKPLSTPGTRLDARRGRSLKILFVEDDDLVRMVATDMLANLGHVVLEAGDGPEALRLFREHEVDVLMTDLGLPGMSGEELAAEASRIKPGLKVVFATGADPAPGVDGARSAMGPVRLHKPYDIESLDAVLRVLGERRAAVKR